jgi:3,4-dihydroxy 2-butanone 4-phosphate synthase / GTP cyclohydrolase II
MQNSSILKRQVKTRVPTEHGDFDVVAYAPDEAAVPHLAWVNGDIHGKEGVLVRIHSECMTGDVFGSRRCDCGPQLQHALRRVAQEGGAVLYLRQEGRGIGLTSKLKAYNLQDEGYDTVEANLHLGFEEDERDYESALFMLKDLGIKSIRLMTNNPEKVAAFADSGIEVVAREPIEIPAHDDNYSYLHTKQVRMGHLLNLNGHAH